MLEDQYNAENSEHIEKANKKAKREKLLRDETIRELMGKKDGRAWVYYLIDQGQMFGNPMVRGDPYDTAFNIGMANMAKLIWQEVESAAPESCALMLKEAKQNENHE